jgi:hypothetical protein
MSGWLGRSVYADAMQTVVWFHVGVVWRAREVIAPRARRGRRGGRPVAVRKISPEFFLKVLAFVVDYRV